MQTLYEMAVRLSFQTVGVDTAVAGVIGLLNRLSRTSATSQAAIDNLRRSMLQIGAGVAITGAGLAGFSVLKGAVDDAAQLESALAKVKLAAVGGRQEVASFMSSLQSELYTVAGKTQFSAVQVANIAAEAMTNGLNKPKDLLAALPTLANVAEVANRVKGMDPKAAVDAAMSLAHQFFAYGGKKFDDLLGLAGRSMLLSSGNMTDTARMTAYLAQARVAYGLTPEDTIGLAALASNVGLSAGRGGASSIAAMLRYLAPLITTRSHHNDARAEIEKLGGSDFFKNGNFEAAGGVTNLLTTVMKAFNKATGGGKINQDKWTTLLNAAFGVQGAKAISVFSTPGAVGRLGNIMDFLGPGGLASISSMQGMLNSTLIGQVTTLKTNLQNLATIIGYQLLPAADGFTHWAVTATAAIVKFADTHQNLVKFAAVFVAISSGLAVVAGGVLAAVGVVGLLSLGFDALGVSISFGLWPLTLLVAGIAAVTYAVMNWGNIVKWLTQVFRPLLSASGELMHDISSWIANLPLVKGLWDDIGKLIKFATDALKDFLIQHGLLDPPKVQKATLTAAAQATAAYRSKHPQANTAPTTPLPGDTTVGLPNTPVVHVPPPTKGHTSIVNVTVHAPGATAKDADAIAAKTAAAVKKDQETRLRHLVQHGSLSTASSHMPGYH